MINARFLEVDYMINNKSISDVNQRASEDSHTIAQNIMDPLLPTLAILDNSSTQVPCCSWRFVSQLDHCMYLGESFDLIPKEYEINPTNYDETMSDVDVYL